MKIECIHCSKKFPDDEVVSFGDEYSCKKCHKDIFDEVNGKGKEVIIDLPDDVTNESDLYDYIDSDYEWFDKQINNEPCYAWLIINIDVENKKAKIKFI